MLVDCLFIKLLLYIQCMYIAPPINGLSLPRICKQLFMYKNQTHCWHLNMNGKIAIRNTTETSAEPLAAALMPRCFRLRRLSVTGMQFRPTTLGPSDSIILGIELSSFPTSSKSCFNGTRNPTFHNPETRITNKFTHLQLAHQTRELGKYNTQEKQN